MFYGDTTRWFIGTVVDVNDPLQLGRLRVRIDGIHSDDKQAIPDDGLPWAQIIIPVNEGGTNGLGNVTGIQPDARVFGIFLDGSDSQCPMVIGTMPKYEESSDGGRSTAQLARGTNTLADDKVPNTVIGEPDSPYDAVYPDNAVHATRSGHVIELDDTPDNERIHIYHKSGSFVEFHPNGDVVTHHANGFKAVAGNDKIHVTGNFELFVDGDMKVTVKGNVIEDFKKSQTTNVKDDVVIDTDDGKIYLN